MAEVRDIIDLPRDSHPDLLRYELQTTIAKCVRDQQVCRDETLLNLWTVFDVAGGA